MRTFAHESFSIRTLSHTNLCLRTDAYEPFPIRTLCLRTSSGYRTNWGLSGLERTPSGLGWATLVSGTGSQSWDGPSRVWNGPQKLRLNPLSRAVHDTHDKLTRLLGPVGTHWPRLIGARSSCSWHDFPPVRPDISPVTRARLGRDLWWGWGEGISVTSAAVWA